MRFLFLCVSVVVVLLGSVGCESVEFDMRNLEQPVMLNSNPCLLVKGAGKVPMTDVDVYSAQVSTLEVVASSSNMTVSSRQINNEAQTKAFLKIGGQSNLVIRSVSLQANAVAVNALLVLAEGVSVQAEGKVTRIGYGTGGSGLHASNRP